MNPLLTVCIPTHNRSQYALDAILSLLRLPAPNLEVVMTDTSTDGLLAQALAAHPAKPLQDPRLRYERPTQRLDMTGNHNAALALARGDYVCLIGDDDSIHFEALEATQWAQRNGVDAIAPEVVANYVWPDFRSRFFGKRHASRLYVAKRFGAISHHTGRDAMALALKNAGQGTNGLPKIYHGIVRRAVLERVRTRTGNYFHGSSPDVSGAMGLSLECQRFVVVKYPLTVPGASGGSNTGRSAMNQHKGKLGAEAQTQAFTQSGWSQGVPRFFSVETVWAHAAIETLTRFDPALLKQFNFARLLAGCTVLHPEYQADTDAAAAQAAQILNISPAVLAQRVRSEARALRLRRALHMIRRASIPTAAGGRHHVDALTTVSQATEALVAFLKARQFSWAAYIASQTPPERQAGT